MTRTRARLLILFGATLMSFVGLIIRQLEMADGYQILFYRSLSLSAMVVVIACLRRRCGPVAFIASLDWRDFVMGLMLGLAFSLYVFSMLNTSVASTLFLLSSSPIFAALLAWMLISEVPSGKVIFAISAAMVGMGVMLADGMGDGRLLGNVFAIASAFLFACMLVFIRGTKRKDALGGTFFGGLVAAAVNGGIAVSIGDGLTVSVHDLALCLFMGAFTIGIGVSLVMWGASYAPAAETGLLVLIESVAGPLWVWLFLAEKVTQTELIGGSIVLISVATLALSAGSGRRPKVA